MADLVGSTSLGMRLDPEDLRNVVAAYHQTVTVVAAQYRGFVARYMGDGVLIYFGYPQANEDDAERGVRAGLAIVNAVSRLSSIAGPSGTLMTRVGIASGVVIVGDLIGSGSSLETAAVGQVPNLAALLQAAAAPNSVVIAQSTRSLSRNAFQYRDLSPVNLKGVGATRICTVLSESSPDTRQLACPEHIPLVGRNEQLTFLLNRWAQVRRGDGRVVLIFGEPGIGKSRLVSALEQAIRCNPIRLSCSPYNQATSLHPIIRHLECAAGFEREDNPDVKRNKLQNHLAPAKLTQQEATLLNDLFLTSEINIDLTTAPQRRQMTLAALSRYFTSLARLEPLLIVAEDIHWADPTTRELLDGQIADIEQVPILLVATTRSEQLPCWATYPQVTVQILGGLHRRDARTLAIEVAGNSTLQEDVLSRIIAQAEGIPLFIEELTKAVLESVAQRSDESAPSKMTRSFEIVIPTSLQAVLTARLDRLGDAKEIAQLASVIGRDFSFELLGTLSGMATPKVRDALTRFVASGLATTRGDPPHSTYSFKHALVQEAAYASLLRDRRLGLHLRLAIIMEKRATSDAPASPEQIAWHFGEARASEKAIHYYQKAAASATGRFALAEMVSHFKKALHQVHLLDESPTKLRLELDLQVALGQTLIDYLGSGNKEVRTAFERARELCLAARDIRQLILVFDGLVLNHHFGHAETAQILHYTTELLELAEGDSLALLCARRAQSAVNLLHGRFEEARNEMQLVINTYKVEDQAHEYRKMARDPRVSTYTLLGICLTALGQTTSGAAMSMQGLKHAEEVNHLASLNTALRRVCIQAILQGDISRVRGLSERLLLLNRRHETFVGNREGMIIQGWAQLRDAWDTLLLQRVKSCLYELDAAKHWVMLPFLMLTVAEVAGCHGDRDSAVGLINRAIELIGLTGERWTEPEALRLKACFAVSDRDSALSLLQKSLVRAREQGARIWIARAELSLARMLHGTNQSPGGSDAPGEKPNIIGACDHQDLQVH